MMMAGGENVESFPRRRRQALRRGGGADGRNRHADLLRDDVG